MKSIKLDTYLESEKLKNRSSRAGNGDRTEKVEIKDGHNQKVKNISILA